MKLRGHPREIALALILAAVLFWLFRPVPPSEATPPRDGDAEGVERALQTLQVPGVDLALLSVQRPGEYEGGGRNLFDYGVIKPPPPSAEELARRAAEAEEQRRREEEEQRRREAERERLRKEALEKQRALAAQRAAEADRPPPGPPKPIPPEIPFRFIGVVGEPTQKIAIFLEDKEFLLAQEGETLKEAFRLERIGYDTLEIGFTDPQFSDETRILQMGK